MNRKFKRTAELYFILCLFNIDNDQKFLLSQHIKMISEDHVAVKPGVMMLKILL